MPPFLITSGTSIVWPHKPRVTFILWQTSRSEKLPEFPTETSAALLATACMGMKLSLFRSVAYYSFRFCSNGECACVNGTSLSHNRRTCVINMPAPPPPPPPCEPCAPCPNYPSCATAAPVIEELVKQSHSGEVVLGVLFTISTVAACAGWFLLWREKRGKGGGYTLTRHDDDFLGGGEDARAI